MDLSDRRHIAAPPDRVWAALMDPEVLKDCIPGCSELTGSPEAGFDAVVTQKVGPVKATFRGRVEIPERDPPHHATLEGSGKGGPAGFARGRAAIRLAPDAGGTILAYDVGAEVGGKLAQLGSRIVDAFAKRMAEQFFARFQEIVETDAPATGPATGPERATEEAVIAADAAGTADAAGRKGWFGRLFG